MTVVAQANAVEHTREHEWRFTSTENTRTDDEGEVCTVYDRFISFEFERPSFPEGFQWAPREIAGQYFLTEQLPFLAPPFLRYMETQGTEWQ